MKRLKVTELVKPDISTILLLQKVNELVDEVNNLKTKLNKVENEANTHGH